MFFISGNFRILTADHSAYPGLLRILFRILVSILTQIKRSYYALVVMTDQERETEEDLPQVPLTDKERIFALFRQLDENEDGRVDVQEIRRRLMKQGIDPSVAEVFMNLYYTLYSILNIIFILRYAHACFEC